MTTIKTPWRNIVQEQLTMLSSAAEQLEYERNIPNVDITRELVAGWFDDAYHPTDSSFRDCFGEQEFAALTEFNKSFKDTLPLLPPSQGTVTTWLSSPLWQNIMGTAASTMKKLEH